MSRSATDLRAVWDVDALRRVAPTLAYAEFVERERDRLLRGAPPVLVDATPSSRPAAAVAHEPRRQPEAERGELGGAARAEGREVTF